MIDDILTVGLAVDVLLRAVVAVQVILLAALVVVVTVDRVREEFRALGAGGRSARYP